MSDEKVNVKCNLCGGNPDVGMTYLPEAKVLVCQLCVVGAMEKQVNPQNPDFLERLRGLQGWFVAELGTDPAIKSIELTDEAKRRLEGFLARKHGNGFRSNSFFKTEVCGVKIINEKCKHLNCITREAPTFLSENTNVECRDCGKVLSWH